MSRESVTIFAENKLYPTKNGFETFTFRPVLIVDGAVTNMKAEVKHENITKISRKQAAHSSMDN